MVEKPLDLNDLNPTELRAEIELLKSKIARLETALAVIEDHSEPQLQTISLAPVFSNEQVKLGP